MTSPAFRVPVTAENGFDVVEADGVVFLRVLVCGRAQYAVPQTSTDLRRLAAQLVTAADLVDAC